ncbi:LOW QUALITY PROTEIN: Hypothetical protein PHPALM_8584 [Phytophthora palmivora]|uniref:DDE-1 domain-containing protein n=1 Tax=Phytophthora palmivora TaxID=4796 RepID=A0A2P4Y9G9_9STRA|nr:LOW QUALITY PROTEIN: Hypothetical protein PHPALM_8584 [Phytophthora palmivora]
MIQENACMNKLKVLRKETDDLSVLLLNNYDCHVSEEGQMLVIVEGNATVVILPSNSTAVCLPLDVDEMVLLKAKPHHSVKCTGGSAKEKRLRAIQSTIAAWVAITQRTEIRSFASAIPQYPEMAV